MDIKQVKERTGQEIYGREVKDEAVVVDKIDETTNWNPIIITEFTDGTIQVCVAVQEEDCAWDTLEYSPQKEG